MVKVGYYTVADVLKTLKISKNTLINWERAKKISLPRRHPMNNYRVYTEEDVAKIKKIIEKGIK